MATLALFVPVASTAKWIFRLSTTPTSNVRRKVPNACSANLRKSVSRSPSQLQALVKVPVISKAEANRRVAYLLAFFACLRSGEFCYSTDDWNNKGTFRRFRTCRRDIQFSSNFDRMTLTLKSSKTSPTEAVRIEVAANHSDPVICPVMAMRVLFHNDPQNSDSPLFNLDGSAFTRDKFHVQACQRLREAGFSTDGILPHSFRKGCAQWMHN